VMVRRRQPGRSSPASLPPPSAPLPPQTRLASAAIAPRFRPSTASDCLPDTLSGGWSAVHRVSARTACDHRAAKRASRSLIAVIMYQSIRVVPSKESFEGFPTVGCDPAISESLVVGMDRSRCGAKLHVEPRLRVVIA
jgi:hypothetical protein